MFTRPWRLLTQLALVAVVFAVTLAVGSDDHLALLQTHAAAYHPSSGTEECVKCPVCLQGIHSECLRRDRDFVRFHKDCDKSEIMCTKEVWECPGAGVFFTYPSVTDIETKSLYETEVYHGTQYDLSPDDSRMKFQYEFINRSVFNPLAKHQVITIAEIGCAKGYLLGKLAAPGRKLLCFEPDPVLAPIAQEWLDKSGADKATVINGVWGSPKVGKGSIDLFVSSHVFEHVNNPCAFLADLYESMKPGGFVFTEIPSHTRDYVNRTFGGLFHLILPNARGFANLMENAGFELVEMATFGENNEFTLANGAHMRSVFRKPLPPPGPNDPEYGWGGLGWN